MTRRTRPQPPDVEDAPHGRGDAKRLKRAGVARHVGSDNAFERESGVGETIIRDNIDAERASLRRSAKIDGDGSIADRQRRGEPNRLVLAVQHKSVAPASL